MTAHPLAVLVSIAVLVVRSPLRPGVGRTCATAGPRLQVEPSRRRARRTASPTSAATGRARRDTKPGGNIGKDLPGWKLPLTPAGEAALKHNLTATIDPESLCIIGGIPRHNASGLPFEVLQGANKIAFLYWYSYFRLIPIDPNRKHSDDPDPSFFGEELGRWEGDTLVIDSIGFKDEKVWIDENANPHSDALHVVERWTRPDADHIHVETLDRGSEVLHASRSRTRERGCSESLTRRFRNTRAARTTSMRPISVSDRVRSVPMARAVTSIPRRCRRLFLACPRSRLVVGSQIHLTAIPTLRYK